jgi:hypothetical protein
MGEADHIDVTPESTGVDASQQQSKELVSLKALPTEGFPTSLSDTIRNLSESGVRGSAGIAILHTCVSMIESNSNRIQEERNKAKLESTEWRDKYHAEEIKCARLSERLKSAGRMKVIQNILLSWGGIMGGLSLKYIIDGNNNWAIYVLIISIILLFAGWLWPVQQVEDSK